MTLDIAKLHEYHIGPRPRCARCGEEVEAGFDLMDPRVYPDDKVYHYECKP